jgi:hypothetical protein
MDLQNATRLSCNAQGPDIMTLTFSGKFKNLKQQTALTGVAGEWCCRQNHYQYRAMTGAVLNWWPSTGTINFQGPESAATDLKEAFFCVIGFETD